MPIFEAVFLARRRLTKTLPDGNVKLSLDQFRNVAKEAEHHTSEKRSHRSVAVSV
jgi:hypothetical protein